MHDLTTIQAELEAFGKTYDYDVRYLSQLAHASPGAFAAFTAAQGMSQFRDVLPLDAHFVARVVTMQIEDCGACAQLNLKMAVEAGVDRELLRTLLEDPGSLPAALQDVRDHVQAVCRGLEQDVERTDRLRAQYGEAGFAELAVVITGSRIYPSAKRSLGSAPYCEFLSLDF